MSATKHRIGSGYWHSEQRHVTHWRRFGVRLATMYVDDGRRVHTLSISRFGVSVEWRRYPNGWQP